LYDESTMSFFDMPHFGRMLLMKLSRSSCQPGSTVPMLALTQIRPNLRFLLRRSVGDGVAGVPSGPGPANSAFFPARRSPQYSPIVS
jgi:hypothetical protein